jgi:hypothetical protein
MRKTKNSEAKIAYKMGQSWVQQITAVIIGLLLTLLVVWITMPNEDARLINKKCFKACQIKLDSRGYTMGFFSGPTYIEALKKCHNECTSTLR